MRLLKLVPLTVVVTGLVWVGAAGACSSIALSVHRLSTGLTGVTVTMKEWGTKPGQAKVPHGKVIFTIRNVGKLTHEFVVVKTKLAAGKLPVKGATVDLSKLKVLGTVKAIKPGGTARLSLTLAAGHYVLLCNLPAHYKAGQFASFTAA